MIRRLLDRLFGLMSINPFITVIVLIVLGFAIVIGTASIKERIDKARFESKVERVDGEIKTNETESQRSDSKGEVLNAEGNRKLTEIKSSINETERLRRELSATNERIRQLSEELKSSGSSNRPTASDCEQCKRARRLGVECNIVECK